MVLLPKYKSKICCCPSMRLLSMNLIIFQSFISTKMRKRARLFCNINAWLNVLYSNDFCKNRSVNVTFTALSKLMVFGIALEISISKVSNSIGKFLLNLIIEEFHFKEVASFRVIGFKRRTFMLPIVITFAISRTQIKI